MPPVISLTLDGITLFSRIRYVVKQAIACDKSKELARVFSTMANTGENLKETNEFSWIFSVLA